VPVSKRLTHMQNREWPNCRYMRFSEIDRPSLGIRFDSDASLMAPLIPYGSGE
jgi:hypothetical protein